MASSVCESSYTSYTARYCATLLVLACLCSWPALLIAQHVFMSWVANCWHFTVAVAVLLFLISISSGAKDEKRETRGEGRGARNIVTGFAHLWNRISSGRTHMPFWHSAHRPCVHYAAYLVAFSCRCPYPDILILNLNSSPRRGALNLTYGHEYAFACECVCVCTCYSHVRRAKTKQRDEKDDGKDTQTRIFRCVREREKQRDSEREGAGAWASRHVLGCCCPPPRTASIPLWRSPTLILATREQVLLSFSRACVRMRRRVSVWNGVCVCQPLCAWPQQVLLPVVVTAIAFSLPPPIH